MITKAQYDTVSDLIAEVAAAEITPRFRNLQRGDITEKHPGDLVTVADRRAEQQLTARLEKLLPGSVTVGEEAVEDDPDLLQALSGDDPVWIIDPVDGTSNFVAGKTTFACLVALAHKGHTFASWLNAPALNLTAGALDGHGAWRNNQPLTATPAPDDGPLRICGTHTNYLAGFDLPGKLAKKGVTYTPCSAAGLSYIDLIDGQYHACVFTWEKPWDHATGLHIHSLVGGANTTADGQPFRLAGDNALPFVAAPGGIISTITALLD
ncbi:MAG TPA: inositol monophosphatase family protein [Stackebrandtia sp.]|uniref:inositol monophosphatase family protein n=1 Tax=Stackebrandtia sp. TaxID=2023065 RepID=UPI002D4606FB|nr:inositol monophosphatase family protein [Stackebrandtia sp.]HZE41675.1 inositol monophosphatase family protein [Stackebrandtia sp.]